MTARAEKRIGKRAVIYVRVSTSSQADKDYNPEGYSIPAQRDACLQKAETLGAEVVDEYVDRGERAGSVYRPQLQAMLARVKRERDVDYVIVHKLDRLARSRVDDTHILVIVQTAGAKLVSVTENIDETPGGMLVHGMMATIAEFYSLNLATEVRKGLRQKARMGGTPNLAPLGYLNTVDVVEGRAIRSVIVDPERAPLVRWMFEAYLTGEFLIHQLADALEDKGLRTRPTRKRPNGARVSVSSVERMLVNPYYTGVVVYEGVEYPGRHEPLISRAMFEEVQELKRSRALSKEKPYAHPHYLKGTLFCGGCGIRMGVTEVTNRHGQTYAYFYCLGRQKKRTECQQGYVSQSVVEDRVTDLWRAIRLPKSTREALRRNVLELVERTQVEQAEEGERQRRSLARLDEERATLLRAHLAGAVPLDLLKREQARIAEEMASSERVLARLNAELGAVQDGLDQALELVADCHRLYEHAPNHVKRQLNQAVFERILVEDGEVPTARLTPAFGELLSLVDRTTTEEVGPGLTGQPAIGQADEVEPPIRYLRTDPRQSWNTRDLDRAIAQILAERETLRVSGGGERKNPEAALQPQGLNVTLLAEGEGFEPSRGVNP